MLGFEKVPEGRVKWGGHFMRSTDRWFREDSQTKPLSDYLACIHNEQLFTYFKTISYGCAKLDIRVIMGWMDVRSTLWFENEAVLRGKPSIHSRVRTHLSRR